MALPDPTEVTADHESKQSAAAASPPMQARIKLRHHEPSWPQLYAREAARIRSALGERVVRLEHAGSTSVQQYADAKTTVIREILARAQSTGSPLPPRARRVEDRPPPW